VRVQDDVDRFSARPPGCGRRRGYRHRRAGASATCVVGRCAGFYVVNSFGTWVPVERTPATGYHVLRLHHDQGSRHSRAPF
jgi:hypothetical protein